MSDRDHRDEIANAIKRIREEKGISQRELARMIKKDPAAVNRIENGGRSIRADTLYMIAEALGVDPAVLLGRNSQEFNDLYEMYQSLGPDQKERLAQQLKDMHELQMLREGE